MKLLFKQRLFSWFDSYDIYDEAGNTVYVVKGQLSWGHKLVIYDAYGNEVGMVVQKVLTFLPKFEIYKNGSYIGCLSKEFPFLTPHYNIDYNGWHIDGTIMEWDYSILDRSGYSIARVSKELFHMTDTYAINERRLLALEKTVDIHSRMLADALDIEELDVLRAVNEYTEALIWIDQYNHQTLCKSDGSRSIYRFTYEECVQMVGNPCWVIRKIKRSQLITPMQEFYNPIPAFVVYVRMYFTLIFQMYCWI